MSHAYIKLVMRLVKCFFGGFCKFVKVVCLRADFIVDFTVNVYFVVNQLNQALIYFVVDSIDQLLGFRT